MKRVIMAAALVIGLGVLQGCGKSYCDVAEDCAKKAGTTFSKTQCETDVKTSKEKASSKNCGSQADDVESCYAGLSCDQLNSDNGTTANCGGKIDALNKCMQ